MSSKKVLITGASSKLGKTFAKHLQSQDYFTYLHYKDSFDKIQGLSDKKNIFIEADFNFLEKSIQNFTNIFEKHGYPDIIINNASTFTNDKLGNMHYETFTENMHVNTITPLFLLSNITEKLNHDSLVINILDYFTDNIPTRNFLSYGIAKSLLTQLTKSLAVSMAPKTRVNAIALSPVICDPSEDPDNFMFRATDNVLGNIIDVAQVISTIDFLINNKAITGEIIRVDSGKHLQMKSDYFNN
ncbi:MAG: SDR family oxidoreductase [Alphaproteobacteria bacterium]|nr:SDR family oxidoreductase [Alphaproteobacteria bacterium]OJV12504.1 MAG: hypothetical protein BGO27_07210 [Alphaproteobacteria bacterium 33-17]